MGTPGTQPIALRPVTPGDEPFLRALYASTRAGELAPLRWDPAQLDAFLEMQFRAREAHYRTQYPSADDRVVLADGAPAGRLNVLRRADDILLVDVALDARHRGLGIGTELIGALLAEAAAAGKTVRLHVEATNPARRLYRRLGFVEVEEAGVYVRMQWPPTQPKAAS